MRCSWGEGGPARTRIGRPRDAVHGRRRDHMPDSATIAIQRLRDVRQDLRARSIKPRLQRSGVEVHWSLAETPVDDPPGTRHARVRRTREGLTHSGTASCAEGPDRERIGKVSGSGCWVNARHWMHDNRFGRRWAPDCDTGGSDGSRRAAGKCDDPGDPDAEREDFQKRLTSLPMRIERASSSAHCLCVPGACACFESLQCASRLLPDYSGKTVPIHP